MGCPGTFFIGGLSVQALPALSSMKVLKKVITFNDIRKRSVEQWLQDIGWCDVCRLGRFFIIMGG